MSTNVKSTKTTVIPCLRYRDAPAAIEWLCATFGFEKHLVVPHENGTIIHAQLQFGNGMIMLGSMSEEERKRPMSQSSESDGVGAQSIYVIVADADAAYARSKAGRAEMVSEIRDMEYGGRGFSCRDLERNIWHFGTYDPWKE